MSLLLREETARIERSIQELNTVRKHLSLFKGGNTLASQLASSYQSAPTNIEVESLVYLGLILLAITFVTNVAAQRLVRRFELQRTGGA